MINMFNEQVMPNVNLYLKEGPTDFIRNFADKDLEDFLNIDTNGHKKSIGALN